nr:hypothetical protein [Tanacetum cinerariifolium]
MDLFAFINHADPTKLWIEERKVREKEVLLLHLTRGSVVSLAGVNDQENANIQCAGENNAEVGGDDAAMAYQIQEGDHVIKDEGANFVRIEDEVPVVVAEKPKELFEQSTLNVEVSVMAAATVPVVTSFVTPTPDRGDGGPTDLFSSSVPPPPLMTAAIATTIITGVIFALVSEVGAEPVSRSIFRDSTSPSTAEADVAGPSQPAARQACLSVEVRLRSEHNYTERKKFKRRCVRLNGLLKDRDAELSYDELSIKASCLESNKDKLIDQVSKPEGTCSELRDEVSEVNLQPRLKLVIKKCLQSPEYLDALGGAIGHAIDKGMQDGLAAGIDHETAGRGLAKVVAYNPIAKANYVVAVSALHDVDFPLLARLASHEYASLLLVENLIGEASASGVPVLATTTTLSTTFVRDITIPLVSVADYEVLGSGPSIEVLSPSKIVFLRRKSWRLRWRTLWLVKDKLPAIFCMAVIIVYVHKISRFKACITDFGVVIFSIFVLLFSSQIADCSLLSSKRSRLISKASSLCTMSISAVLKVGMPISTGITASVSYPRLYSFPQASVCSFHQTIGLWMPNEGKVLVYAQLFTSIFKWVIYELLPVIEYYFSRTLLITAYRPDFHRMALAFFFSTRSISFVSSLEITFLCAFFMVLKNGSDFSVDLERNLFRLAKFPFSFLSRSGILQAEWHFGIEEYPLACDERCFLFIIFVHFYSMISFVFEIHAHSPAVIMFSHHYWVPQPTVIMDFFHYAGVYQFSTSSCIALFLFGARLLFFCLTGEHPSRTFSLCFAMCHGTPVMSAGFQANMSRSYLSCTSGSKTIVHLSGMILLLRRALKELGVGDSVHESRDSHAFWDSLNLATLSLNLCTKSFVDS